MHKFNAEEPFEEKILDEQFIEKLSENFKFQPDEWEESKQPGDIDGINEILGQFGSEIIKEKLRNLEKISGYIKKGFLAYDRKDKYIVDPLSKRYKADYDKDTGKLLNIGEIDILAWAKEITGGREEILVEEQEGLLRGYLIAELASLEKNGIKDKDIEDLFDIFKLIIRIRTEEKTKSEIGKTMKEEVCYFSKQLSELKKTLSSQSDRGKFDSFFFIT
ncbi:MAG: hypothetical protein V1649_01000 [Patescibacteria group bacterium]